MKPGLQIQIGQHLTMTPQLQQAIRLLQLSTLDLRQEIQEAIEANPLRELEEGVRQYTAGISEKDLETCSNTLAKIIGNMEEYTNN